MKLVTRCEVIYEMRSSLRDARHVRLVTKVRS